MRGFLLLPAVVMVAGAALAVWCAPGPQVRSATLHFAAGVVFSVVAVELLSLGLATAVELRRGGHGKARAVGIVAGLSLLLLAGAGIGTTVLRGATGHVLEIVLSFGLAALLFLVTEELLTAAHEEEETPLLTLAFFVGFLLFLLLDMVS